MLLEVRGLCAGYAGSRAGYAGSDVIHDVEILVETGEAVAVIGANGAGKTTMLRAICGLLGISGGGVRFDGNDVTGTPTHLLCRAGLAYVPAERHLFPQMTVAENLALGAHPDKPDRVRLDRVLELFPRLAERRTQRAGTMSGGEQQMLAIGRALMSTPRLLILDEPTTGLAPIPAADTYGALASLGQDGVTILVAEQQVPLALGLADRGYVIQNGRISLEGTAADLADDPGVRSAYLGIT